MFADEWKNFLARIGRDESTSELELGDNPNHILELRFWASYRGQTLARTGESYVLFSTYSDLSSVMLQVHGSVFIV